MPVSNTYLIQANGTRLYSVADDITSVYRAVITGAVSDEILGDFVAPGFTVSVTRTDLGCKTTAEGLFAITGYVEQSFPKLNLMGYSVDLTLGAPGFRDYALSVAIPQNASFPVPAPAIAMRRLPVRVQGRIVADTAQRLPIAGARVSSVDPSSPPPSHLVALRSPLYFAHAAAVTALELSMTVSGSAQLTSVAANGAKVLNLSDRTGLAVDSVLRLSNASRTLLEYGVVESMGPGSGTGQVFLRNALNRTYSAGVATQVDFVSPGAVTATATLSADANAGDGILVASQLLTGPTVAIEPGTAAVEYHDLGAVTDSNGYYFLDGIGRTPEIFLQASAGGFTALTQGWVVEYDQEVNVVDFRLQ